MALPFRRRTFLVTDSTMPWLPLPSAVVTTVRGSPDDVGVVVTRMA